MLNRDIANDDAHACWSKLTAPGGCDIVFVEKLYLCLKAGASLASLETTPEAIEKIRVDICHTHARQWLTLIRIERSHNRNVKDMVIHMKKWLKEGELDYDKIKATSEEVTFFGPITPENQVL